MTTAMEAERAGVPADVWEMIQRLNRDMMSAAELLGQDEVGWMVDYYYAIQDFRIQAGNRVKATGGEPNRIVRWLSESMRALEADMQKALGRFAATYRSGQWLMSICGIGPVISAGLLANLDVPAPPTYGHWKRFAGIDPSVVWKSRADSLKRLKEKFPDRDTVTQEEAFAAVMEFGRRPTNIFREQIAAGTEKYKLAQMATLLAKRPWNAGLKVLLWKASDCFVKFQNNPKDYYGKLYREYKAAEIEKNESGRNKEAAARALSERNFGADTDARKYYESGKLPPAHIHARALRDVQALFLAHIHNVMYIDYYGTQPPVPYAFAKLNHDPSHFKPVPNWPHGEDGRPLIQFPGEFDGRPIVQLESRKARNGSEKKADDSAQCASERPANGVE